MRDIFNATVQSYIGGVFFIMLGVIWFYFQRKRKKIGTEYNEIGISIKGYAGSIFTIICGVLIIIFKLIGKL